VVLLLLISTHLATAAWVLGKQGENCWDACYAKGLNCNPRIITQNSADVFKSVGSNCKPNPKSWWAEDQPSVVSDPNDPNYGECLGYVNVPASVSCVGSFETTSRLCNCDDPRSSSPVGAFGTGYSDGYISQTERTMFTHVLNPISTHGVMTHFWSTAGYPILENSLIRYYIDGESVPSIEFSPPLACGAGFNDQHNTWGLKWFGKGAQNGAWHNNFRIPFGKSVKTTAQSLNGTYGGFFIIFRGVPNLHINIGGIDIPSKAKLHLQVFNKLVNPIEWVPIASVHSGSGLFFMHTLAVQSGNLNFLEGCYHAYTPFTQSFPGTVLSTGTEDYFDSAWYFDGGKFWLPVSGFTHLEFSNKSVTWSAYRFHEMDPLPFSDGFKLMWRNGDVVDDAGIKCYAEEGHIVGKPTHSYVTAYGWVYTW